MKEVRRIPQARSTLIVCGVMALLATGAAFADDPAQSTRPAPTKEQREKMAQAHDRIAACLRSDQAIEECHKEMMKDHEGMMHHHPMQGPPTASPAQN